MRRRRIFRDDSRARKLIDPSFQLGAPIVIGLNGSQIEKARRARRYVGADVVSASISAAIDDVMQAKTRPIERNEQAASTSFPGRLTKPAAVQIADKHRV